MLKSGVCSITFRELTVEQIVDLAGRAGLDAVEWGGDIHVPHGDAATAEEALRVTHNAGLEVSSYGSYYSVLDREGNPQPFEPVLESALALQTDTIRIWPGARPSQTAGSNYRKKFVEKLHSDLDAAASVGVHLALEFHVNSFTDSNVAAQRILDEMSRPNLCLYWQPIYWLSDPGYCCHGLDALKNHVANLHVFNWQFHPYTGSWSDHIERRPLCEGAVPWKRFFSVYLTEDVHYALLEFVLNDDPDQFLEDARVLKGWIRESEQVERVA